MEIEEKTTLFLKDKMLGGVGDKLLREKVEALVEAGRVNIVLDLSDLLYVDSACVGEMIRCKKKMNQRNGELKFTNINEGLRHLLSRTGLWPIFDEGA